MLVPSPIGRLKERPVGETWRQVYQKVHQLSPGTILLAPWAREEGLKLKKELRSTGHLLRRGIGRVQLHPIHSRADAVGSLAALLVGRWSRKRSGDACGLRRQLQQSRDHLVATWR